MLGGLGWEMAMMSMVSKMELRRERLLFPHHHPPKDVSASVNERRKYLLWSFLRFWVTQVPWEPAADPGTQVTAAQGQGSALLSVPSQMK